MIVIRYATLVALVLWLSSTVGARFGDVFRRFDLLAYACGAAILVGLFVMKFLGPPPHAFILRVALVVLMLAIAAASALFVTPDVSTMLLTVNIGLGLVLLSWYVRE